VSAPKVLAFVLPQFHRIPENDAWWGEGFTEWTNVRKAKPLFDRHYQPRVPADNRYYDLSDPAVHEWQASLAREHGVYGFCYYHYWFNGKQLLEKPIDLLLRRGQPNLPFCLAWANEPWTRAWDGGEHQVLMPQSYGDETDWRRHFAYLLRAFQDPRYIRVDGKPMFLIYRSASIDVCEPMFLLWRELAKQAGLPGLHLVGMLTGFDRDRRAGLFDAFAEFEPMYTIRHGLPYWLRKREKWIRRVTTAIWRVFGRGPHAPNSYDYVSLWNALVSRELPPRTYPGAFVDWDNSPRRGLERSMVMRKFDLRTFENGMRAQLCKAQRTNAEFLFVNAWNEWAEGAYLEPDVGRGRALLKAVATAVETADASLRHRVSGDQELVVLPDR
jgi:hypothetical protein